VKPLPPGNGGILTLTEPDVRQIASETRSMIAVRPARIRAPVEDRALHWLGLYLRVRVTTIGRHATKQGG